MSSAFYKEVRGVMTRFLPLTDELLTDKTPDGPTYTELADALSRHGLNIQLVVHDPTRAILNTYYADYERGLYGEILLQRDLRSALMPVIKASEALAGLSAPELGSKDWHRYYSLRVPLPMQIYDFVRRYGDIAPEDVFSVWHSIHKRIDFSNGMWPPEVLDYVFAHAPTPEIPEQDAHGLVTIYRGMGELSAPPEQAISWSAHPGNALWFANHSGRGTHVAVARIRPEQIVAYDGSFSNENEVIVRPGAVTGYRYEDMIPATQEEVPRLLAAALSDYLRYGRQAQALGYQEESIFQLHGLKHILRVLLLSLIYYYHSGDVLSDADKRILIYFSLFHDIGRTNEDIDDTHGARSVSLIHAKCLRVRGLPMIRKEYRIAELLIEHHCHDDAVGEAAIQAMPGLSRKEKAWATHLYHICKDMDGLDRVRFNGLDYRRLRTEYGRRLPLVAGCLLDEQMVKALEYDLGSI